jgi:hypothetical protein
MSVHLVNPSDNSFDTAVITPRWLFVLAAATPEAAGDLIFVDESLEQLDPSTIQAGDVVGISVHTGNALRGYELRKRQESISEEVKEIAWKAQHRLHKRYMRLAAAGKDKRKITTAVARELLGFIWAIGTRAETTVRQRIAA